MQPRRTARVALGMVAAVMMVGSCSSSPSTPRALVFQDLAARVAMDSMSGFTIAGADPARPVKVTATTTDARGTTWSSSGAFTPDDSGRVAVSSSAPTTGSYRGAHATGLIWSMAPSRPDQVALITPRSGTITVTYTATQSGRMSATGSQRRVERATGVRARTLAIEQAGFDGVYYAPAPTPAPRSAVLVFGGSEGGDGAPIVEAMELASHGHPALAIAYLGAPGLPSTLANIPLEYFAKALRWLSRQDGVDPHRVVVSGGSRGSEAALLLAVEYPTLVAAVIAASPAAFVGPGYPDLTQPAWTRHGRPVPFVDADHLDAPLADMPTTTLIPVQDVHGPMFLTCGTDDELWPSCEFAKNDASRAGASAPVTLLAEPGAGHLVTFPVPNHPFGSSSINSAHGTLQAGGTVQADALARLDIWPKLLSFLDHLP